MQAIGTWKNGFETLLEDDHAHSVVVDLPVNEGGRSVGPSALELSVLALAGSITTTFALVARKRHLLFHGLTVALEAERPTRAPTIARVRGTLRVRSRAEPSEVEAALRVTIKTCPVGVIFARAGIPVDISPIVTAGPAPA